MKMYLNKRLTTFAIPASVALALVISAIGISPSRAAASTYDYNACLAKWSKVKDVEKLRDKAINPAIKNREAKVDQLKGRLDKVRPEHASAMTNELNADLAVLKEIKGRAASEKNATRQQQNYCQVLFKVQIFSFRAKQVSYLRYSDSQYKRAAALHKVLHNERNTNVKNVPLRADIVQRLEAGRTAIDTVVRETDAASKAVLAAKVDESANYSIQSLQKPTFNGIDVGQLYQGAYSAYTEANVVRKASNQLIKIEKNAANRAKAQVEAVELTNDAGADAKQNAKDAKKAKVKYKKGTVNKEEQKLKRKDVKSNWEDDSSQTGGAAYEG